MTDAQYRRQYDRLYVQSMKAGSAEECDRIDAKLKALNEARRMVTVQQCPSCNVHVYCADGVLPCLPEGSLMRPYETETHVMRAGRLVPKPPPVRRVPGRPYETRTHIMRAGRLVPKRKGA